MESYAMPKDEIYLGDLSWDCLWFLNGFARIETKQKQIQIKLCFVKSHNALPHLLAEFLRV